MHQQKRLLENKLSTKNIMQKIIVYIFIAIYTVISFLFVFFTILPTINNAGLLAFGANENMLLSYGLLPFMCIDMCIVKGYFWILKKAIKKTLNITAGKDVAVSE